MALRLRKPVDFTGCWQRHVSQQGRNYSLEVVVRKCTAYRIWPAIQHVWRGLGLC